MANRNIYAQNKSKNPKSTTSTTSTQSGTRTASTSGSSSGMSGGNASNLSQYYAGKGSQLGNSVSSRFSDPDFAGAAQRAGISQSQYSINPGNASYNQSILRELQNGGNTQSTNPLDNAQVQTPSTPTTPSMEELGITDNNQYTTDFNYSGSKIDPVYSNALSYFGGQMNQNIDDKKVRRDILSQFNDRIAATNQIYDETLARARQMGQGDVGSGTALLAARGLTGSGRGMAMAQGIQDQNMQREEGVQAQRLAAISAIQNEAQALAQQAIADKEAAKQSGYAGYIQYLGKYNEQKDAAKSALAQSIISKGLDINTINPQQLESIAKGIGATGDEVRNVYDVLKKEQEAAEAKALQDSYYTLSEGQQRFDANGNVVASVAKTFAPDSGGGFGRSESLFASLGSKTTTAVLSQADKFATNPIVQKYNDLIGVSNVIMGVDPKTTNPADHQAVIYNFAKALDPDSVVREGEYATIQKYSQPINKKYGGQLKQALSGKGFLSPEAIIAMQKATNDRVKAYAPQYDNLKKQTGARIDAISGMPGTADIVLLDYETGATPIPDVPDPSKKTQYKQGADGNFYPVSNTSFNQVVNTKVSVAIPQSSRLAYVNNNPGNLRFAGQKGAVQGQGGFARFQSPQQGYDALRNQIRLDTGRGHTVGSFINKYAPPSENDTGGYISNVTRSLGVSPNTPLSQVDLDAIARAVARQESSTNIA